MGFARDDDITGGLICVLHTVEPCRFYQIRKDPASKHLVLESAPASALTAITTGSTPPSASWAPASRPGSLSASRSGSTAESGAPAR